MPKTKVSETAKQARGLVKKDLEIYFRAFLKSAWEEEKRFLLDVFKSWDARTIPESATKTGEVPLLTAFQVNVDGMAVQKVPYGTGDEGYYQAPKAKVRY